LLSHSIVHHRLWLLYYPQWLLTRLLYQFQKVYMVLRCLYQLFFLVIGRIFDNRTKRQEFVNSVIKGDLVNVKDPQKLKKKFEDIVDDLAKEYSKELAAEENLYSDFKKSNEFKDYSEGLDEKLYSKGKTRKFNYTTVPTTDEKNQKEAISKLYSGENDGETNTYIGKAKFNS